DTRRFAMPARFAVRLHRWWNESKRFDKVTHAVPLRVEELENRSLPSVAPNQAFLATLYQGELGRNIEADALTYWNNALSQTASRTQVAGAILNSDEYFGREVTLDYHSLLGRDPDPLGLQSFVQVLRTGATPQQVQTQIMGSNEFFARVGSDPV